MKFEQATGDTQAANVSDYYGAGEDAIYLSGIAAGAATKTGTVGYVVAVRDPRGDPAHERLRARCADRASRREGEDHLDELLVRARQGEEGGREPEGGRRRRDRPERRHPAIGQYDESQGIPWVGYDSNAQKFAPKQWLTGAVYNWGPYYLQEVKAAMNGGWKSQFYYGSLKSGFAKLAPFGPGVSAATKALIAKKQKQIESGTWNEFQGPIYDQSGELRVKKGQKLTVKQLYAIDWLVKGVIGSPKG